MFENCTKFARKRLKIGKLTKFLNFLLWGQHQKSLQKTFRTKLSLFQLNSMGKSFKFGYDFGKNAAQIVIFSHMETCVLQN